MATKGSPIQQKLMKLIMLTSGIVLVMTCAAFFVYEYITAHEISKRQITTLGRIIANNSTAALASDSKKDATEILYGLQVEENIIAAAFYDEKGQLFATYPENLDGKKIPASSRAAGYHFKNSLLEGFEPVNHNGEILGWLYIKLDMTYMYDRFKLYGIIALTFIVISFVFAYLISKQLQTSISHPILELADTARVVSEQRNYSVRSVKRSDDEVGDLTDAFNHMLTRIEMQNAEITGLNHNLEEKVKKRTRQLEMAYEALKEEKEFSETILDSSVDIIAVFDTDFRYVGLNKQTEIIYKKTKEELIGKYVYEVFPQVKESGMLDDLKRAVTGEFVHHLNYKSIVTNRQYENYYIPLKDKDNRVNRILTIAHDITDIMLANEKLRTLNAELEKSNRELEQFAYVASHDLQEPLRKIQTFSELGEKNLGNQEILKRYLNKVNSSAQRMTDLIKAVLNYSRLSKSENDFVEVDLNEILQSILVDLELLIEEKKAVIKSDRLPVIFGIPLQLHQLFLNLIINSLKFNENLPSIAITSNKVQGKEVPPFPLLNKEMDYVQLIFTDNGIGFDPKFADKIFSIFQRLHTDKSFTGTGIGLAVCKKIVENHLGMITVKSQPKQGATFFIYIPELHSTTDQLTNTSSTKKIAF